VVKSAGNRSSCPRLSQAKDLLPLIHGRLIEAACRYGIAIALDLCPIVKDGLFGYELIPECDTHTYLIIGCDTEGRPVVRKTSYGCGAPDALRLAAVNGRLLSRSERAIRYRVKPLWKRSNGWSGS
jgi:hypothetical protein